VAAPLRLRPGPRAHEQRRYSAGEQHL
jgi:hypothetical protein